MRKILKKIISRAYWLINNRVKHTFVESSCVSSKIRIGEFCWIRRGAEVNDNVEVGDYSYIGGPNTYIDEAVIGKFCSIARNVVIGPVNHNYNCVSTHPFICSKFYKFIKFDKTDLQSHVPVIGNDVWIGVNCIILRGVKIGHGAVVGAGSIVSRDVAPYSIVTGIPARHMKYRYPEHIRKALLEMKWWDWNKDRLKGSIPYMYDVQEFVKRYHEDTRFSKTCEYIGKKEMSSLKVMNLD